MYVLLCSQQLSVGRPLQMRPHLKDAEGENTVFINLGPCRCVLIREVSSFQRVKCVVFVNITWGLENASSLER